MTEIDIIMENIAEGVINARKSLQLHLSPAFGFFDLEHSYTLFGHVFLKEFLGMPKLNLSCLISSANTPDKYSNVLDKCKLYLKNFGWAIEETKNLAYFDFMIVDEEYVIFWHLSDLQVRIGSGSATVKYHVKYFNSLFNKEMDFIFANLSKFIPQAKANEVIKSSNEKWNGIIEYLSTQPQYIYDLEPRKFEEFVAELLVRQGMEVQLTSQTRDNGRDILAWANTVAGRQLYLVECKHWKKNPIDVKLVRALYGVVESDRATGGVIVTTSRFTSTAMKYQKEIKHRLNLVDYETLKAWIAKTAHSSDLKGQPLRAE